MTAKPPGDAATPAGRGGPRAGRGPRPGDPDPTAATAPAPDSGDSGGGSGSGGGGHGPRLEGSVAHARLTELFGEALSLSTGGRAAMIERLRGEGDGGQLADELEALLAADAAADTALHTGGLAATVSLGPASGRGPGLEIPGYRLLRVLGEGGMGTVYAAEQESPRRQVAIKVLHARSPNALVRFRAEADIMARLDHPGIARVLEAGDAGGQPYLVMEHVDGVTLDRYARELDREQRLALFAELCEAIHHAHVKSVIHRDLKPSNVMVRPTGRVVVLDFGVARLASAEGSTPSDTRAGDLIGTPIYMSPEQARLQADKVDARSDVYTLGVMLYELLCDELPYDVRGLALPAVTRLITEDEPRSLGRRVPELRGDLDAITHKALRKAPDERYQSALALGEDVRRHLQRLPVSVRSPGTVEQLQRFIRRRPLLAASIAGALLAVTAFAVIVTGLWLEARAARRTAEAAQQRTAEAQRRTEAAQRRTEAARAELEARGNQLILRQARAVVSRDPTEALAWLATATERALDLEAAWAVVDEAIGRGVASQVWHAHKDEVHWIEPVAGGGFVTAGYDGQVMGFEGTAAPRLLFQAARGRLLMVRPSPDGAQLAVGGEDGALHVVPRGGGAAVALGGHQGELQQVGWSQSGDLLASGDDQGNVWVWPAGAAPGAHLGRLTASIGTLELSPSGGALVAGVDDGEVTLWQLAGAPGKRGGLACAEPACFPGARGAIRGKPVGSWTDGERVLVVDGEGVVHRLRRAGGRLDEAPPVVTGVPIKRALFAADGAWVMLGGVGGSVLRVTIGAGAAGAAAGTTAGAAAGSRIESIATHRAQVRSLAMSPDGALIASASDDGQIQVLDQHSGRRLTLLGHSARVRHLAFTGGALLSADGDGLVRRWELPRVPSVLDAGGAPIGSLVASADGARLASVASDGEVTAWTLASGGRERRGRVAGQLSALALDGDVVITGTIEGKVTWWPPGAAMAGAPGAPGMPSAPVIRAVPGIAKAIRAGGGKLAVATSSGAIALFSSSGERLATAMAHVEGADIVAWHPGGALLASGGQDRTVRLWRVASTPATLATLVPVGALEGLTGDTHFLEFSPDGSSLFAADDDGLVMAWRLDGDRVDAGSRTTVVQHGGAVSALAVAPDGRYLATSGLDKVLTRVELATSQTMTIPFGDVAAALAFDASDGLYAVTRTGAVSRATPEGAHTLIDHGATAGAAIPPGRLAVALDDGAILIAPLLPRSFAALRQTLASATSYALPDAVTPAE